MPINSPDVFDSIGDAIVSGGGGGGVTTFVALNDTPSSYTGQGGNFVAVNAGATALEFVSPPSGTTTFLGLNDTPASYSGNGKKVLVVNSGETAVAFSNDIQASLDGQKIKFDVRDDAYGTTGDHEGSLLKLGTATQTQGNVLYWNGTDWADADASAEATAKGMLAIAHSTGAPSSVGVLAIGLIQLAAAPATAGDVLFLSETAGGLTATAPTTSGAIVRVMGYDVDGAGLIYFNPSPDFFEV